MMIKKWLIFALTAFLILGLAACGSDEEPADSVYKTDIQEYIAEILDSTGDIYEFEVSEKNKEDRTLQVSCKVSYTSKRGAEKATFDLTYEYENRDWALEKCRVTPIREERPQIDTITILRQPTDCTVPIGNVAVLSVAALGDDLTYEWFAKDLDENDFDKSTVNTADSYSVRMEEDKHGRQVYCKITDAAGNSITTDTVSVNIGTPPIVIVRQPWTCPTPNKKSAKLTVFATGNELTYEWWAMDVGDTIFYKSPSQNTDTYVVTMDETRNGRKVYCKITDADGNFMFTKTTTLTMGTPSIVITQQPVDTAVSNGTPLEVHVEATGKNLTYEWWIMDAEDTCFYKSPTQTTNTYSTEMKDERDGRKLCCKIIDGDGNVVYTDVVTISMTD